MAGPTTAPDDTAQSSPSGPSASAGARRPPRLRLPRLRRVRRPRRRTAALVLVAAVLPAGAVLWLLYGSAWLRAERVRVDGVRVLAPAEVREAAAVPLGEPLASVDTAAVAARLRERFPRIDSVEAVRSWPRTLDLKVVERRPEVFLEKGGKFVEVDGEGVRFATVDRPPEGVPRLESDFRGSPAAGRFAPDRLRREAVRVAAALPEAVHRQTRTVRIRSYDSVTLELTGGRTVVWGSSERGAAKAKTLLALMKAARGADHFDVSAPSAPAASES